MERIGFIGLGNMGKPIAENLARAGFPMTVMDLNPEPVADLVELGATAAASLRQLAEASDIICTVVMNDRQTLSLFLDQEDGGLLSHMRPGSLIVIHSTISMETCHALSAAATEKGIHVIDAAVSGAAAAAEQGALSVIAGGLEEHVARAQPLFDIIGKRTYHMGALGMGQAAKICNNMLLAITMIGTCEAFALAEKLGLDAQNFFDIASKASGQSWSMTSYCPVAGPMPGTPANHGYKPGFATAMMLKDLKLAQDAAQASGASTPLGAQAEALYAMFGNLGGQDLDFSAIYKMVNGSWKAD